MLAQKTAIYNTQSKKNVVQYWTTHLESDKAAYWWQWKRAYHPPKPHISSIENEILITIGIFFICHSSHDGLWFSHYWNKPQRNCPSINFKTLLLQQLEQNFQPTLYCKLSKLKQSIMCTTSKWQLEVKTLYLRSYFWFVTNLLYEHDRL